MNAAERAALKDIETRCHIRAPGCYGCLARAALAPGLGVVE